MIKKMLITFFPKVDPKEDENELKTIMVGQEKLTWRIILQEIIQSEI
jgi:hypothetical protein